MLQFLRRPVRSLLCLGILLLLLAGCGALGGEKTPLLSYQKYPLRAEGELRAGEESATVTVEMTGPMTARLSFSSPDSLRGYLFAVNEEGVTLSYGDITVPYRADGIPGGPHLLPRLFSLEEEALLEVEEKTLNSMPVRVALFGTPEGETVKLYLDGQTGTPLRFEVIPAGGKAEDAAVFTVTALRVGEGDLSSGETPQSSGEAPQGGENS